MVAIVTLHVNNCSNGSNLSGAAVTDGYSTVYTNAYGEIAVYWDNTVYAGYSVLISKSGFQSRQINIYNSQNGTTVTTCLDPASGGGGSTGGGGTSGGISCFIVSAATGSAQSDEVVALRALRDQVAARAPAAGRLIDAIYDEYWQFSPALADRITGDGMLKQGALLATVKPLLAWYRLAGALALQGDVESAHEALSSACPFWMQPSKLAAMIGRIRLERSVPDDAPAMVRDLGDHLGRAASLPLVDWAILYPLEMCWLIAAKRLDPMQTIADWLATAPVEPMAGSSLNDLHQVSALLDFEPGARRRLEERLNSGGRDCCTLA